MKQKLYAGKKMVFCKNCKYKTPDARGEDYQPFCEGKKVYQWDYVEGKRYRVGQYCADINIDGYCAYYESEGDKKP